MAKHLKWIGKTQLIAKIRFAQVPEFRTKPDLEPLERCLLFTGPPGTGKTSLAEALAADISSNTLDVEQINGQSCTVERVRRWMEQGWYAPMGVCRVQMVDEIDAASLPACNELRTYLDKLPKRTVFIATTNKPIKELQEQLQSRFRVSYFEKVAHETLTEWLVRQFGLAIGVASEIAKGAAGNVRAAKADAIDQLRAVAALQA